MPKRERKLTDPDLLRAANSIDWRKKGDPGLAALFYKSHSRQAEYPEEPTRILPTRLGNILRSSEEPLGLQGHALERFIMENYDRIPARLMSQHDQFRDRLDMYSLLVLVFTILALAAIPITWTIAWPWPWLPSPAVAFASLAILAWMSYEAAVASARGYGATLLAINHTIKQKEAAPAQEGP